MSLRHNQIDHDQGRPECFPTSLSLYLAKEQNDDVRISRRALRQLSRDRYPRLDCGDRALTTNEASPQTDESCRISSQHSRWLSSLIDVFRTTVKMTACFARSSLGSLRGHRPTRHSPSDPASPRSGGLAKAFHAPLPPRYLAFEEGKV